LENFRAGESSKKKAGWLANRVGKIIFGQAAGSASLLEKPAIFIQ
jgi:hypothetical protein